MDLNNITMDDLKAKFAAFDKKTLIKFGIGFGSIVLFLIIYYAILNPMVKERKAKFDDKILKQQEIQKFENDIVKIKKRIKELEPIVQKKIQDYFTPKQKLKDYIRALVDLQEHMV